MNAELKESALGIFRAGLAAVDARAAVASCLKRDGDTLIVAAPSGEQQRYDLQKFRRVVVVGGGKATAFMAAAVEQVVRGRLDQGLIVVKYEHTTPLSEQVEVVEAAHPVPDQAGEEGARRILELVSDLGDDALVISLISGGGSALMPLPADGITLADKQAVTGMLLSAGADIGEVNAVRKHISALKGGQLARAAYPATVLNLMLSDVVGDPLDVIASGPAVPDNSTFADAKAALMRCGVWDKAPTGVRTRIDAGTAGEIDETPKAGDPIFERCQNLVVGSNIIALKACLAEASRRGFNAILLASSIEGETREIAQVHAAIAREIRASALPVPPPACVISGGETTVTLRGSGKGGRNQELALAAARQIAGQQKMAVFSAGTDGTDGPTDAAGAIAFGDTAARAEQAGFSVDGALEDNNAYPLFRAIDDLIITGPTGTNVMDVHLVLVPSLHDKPSSI